MSLSVYLAACLVLVVTTLCSGHYTLQTFAGRVGGGNFTYYRLTREGDLTLVLDSVEGDTDLYVSQSNLNPDYNDYDLKSATCGEDFVEIPKDFKRPIGVGVYGYLVQHSNSYRLSVIVDYPSADLYEGSYQGRQPETEEESLLWTIFVGILKILFDILL